MSVRQKFQIGNIYHLVNRGVEKRITFNNPYDYLRFLESLNEFNRVDRVYSLRDKFLRNVPSGPTAVNTAVGPLGGF